MRAPQKTVNKRLRTLPSQNDGDTSSDPKDARLIRPKIPEPISRRLTAARKLKKD